MDKDMKVYTIQGVQIQSSYIMGHMIVNIAKGIQDSLMSNNVLYEIQLQQLTSVLEKEFLFFYKFDIKKRIIAQILEREGY